MTQCSLKIENQTLLRKGRRHLGRGPLCLILSLAACLACNARLREPSLQLEPKDRVDTLREDLALLASDALEGRATGTEGNAKARQFLIERLESLGATPWQSASLEQPFEVERRQSEPTDGVNVVAMFPATHSDPASARGILVLTAHYDHLGERNGEIFNGADDNASGVVALLDMARRASESSTHNDVVLAFLDAEELGLQGARAFVEALSEEVRKRLLLNINLDMIGRSDGGALFVAGTSHTPALRNTMNSIAVNSAIDLQLGHDTGGGANDWTFSSDHAAFHRAGIPFLYFGVEDHDDYHRPSDDSERIDYEFLAHAIDVVWQSTLAFDAPHAASILRELR